MHDIEVFFTTKIKNTGRLAALGNFFLAPVRFFFSGKTIANVEDGIAEVPSFSWEKTIIARRDNNLQSTLINITYAAAVIYFFGSLIAVIPGILLGAFFKGLSYIKNPEIQTIHRDVKKRLAPEDKLIKWPMPSSQTPKKIADCLKEYSMTGQHTNALIIENEDKNYLTLDGECLVEIKDYIKPSKLILHKTEISKNLFFPQNWDTRALEFFTVRNKKKIGDYTSIQPQVSEPHSSPPGKASEPLALFPKPKKISGLRSSVAEALKGPLRWERDPFFPHRIYVIEDKKSSSP